MNLAIAGDHAGFELKQWLKDKLETAGHEVRDFGACTYVKTDDYPDTIIPLAQAVGAGAVERGIAVCGSGVGACIAANKIAGVRAALITDPFSARQGVEDDDMNVLCLGARVIGRELAMELVDRFLQARFSGLERHKRRLAKVAEFDKSRRPDP